MTHRWTVPLPVCWAFVSRLDLLRQLGWFSWGMRMPFFYLFWKFLFFCCFSKMKNIFLKWWNYFDSTEMKLFDWIQMRSETKKTHQGGKVIFQPLKLWVTEKSTIMNTVNNVWVIEICYIYLFTEKGDKDSFWEEIKFFVLHYLFFIWILWKEP